jgi:hypothetical protein
MFQENDLDKRNSNGLLSLLLATSCMREAAGDEPSLLSDVPAIEINDVFRVGFTLPRRVDRRLDEPQPLRNGGV